MYKTKKRNKRKKEKGKKKETEKQRNKKVTMGRPKLGRWKAVPKGPLLQANPINHRLTIRSSFGQLTQFIDTIVVLNKWNGQG